MLRSNTVTRGARRGPAKGGARGRSVARQVKPGKKQGPQQDYDPLDVDDEWFAEADWDDTGLPGKDSHKARQRIELIREERLLQQSLRDTFDW